MKNIIEIKNVSLTLHNHSTPILAKINYQIHPADFIIILGSNGSGKSSLLKLLDRRFVATTGEILLHNKPITSFSTKEFSKKIITLTQNSNESLFGALTVLENYLISKEREGNKSFFYSQKTERLIFSDYIKEFNQNLATKCNQIVDKLSGGEKQALALALSVLYPPDILLLDEHTSALDPKKASELMELTYAYIKKHNITCVLTTHDLDIALQYGNRILALRKGEIYQAIEFDKKQKITQQELIDSCY